MTRHTHGPAPRRSSRALSGNLVYQALARKPMSDSLQRLKAIDARMAFEATSAGKATRADRETLAGLVNCVMVLAERNCIPADLQTAQDAQMALLRADARAQQGKGWNFDGEGRQQVLAALTFFEQMVATIGQGEVSMALMIVMERTRAGQVHRIEFVKEAMHEQT